jgi:hypothetical protein
MAVRPHTTDADSPPPVHGRNTDTVRRVPTPFHPILELLQSLRNRSLGEILGMAG